MRTQRAILTISMLLGSVPAFAQMTFDPVKGTWSDDEAARDASTFKTDASEYYRALALYQGGRAKEAIRICERIEKEFDEGPWLERAILLKARAYFNLGDARRADNILTDLRKRFPATTLTREMSDLKLAIGIAYTERGKYAGVTILTELIEENPYGPRADEAQFKIGQLYMAKEDYYEAAQAFELVVATYKDSPYREESMFLKAKMTYLQNQGLRRDPLPYREAADSLEFYLGQYPKGKFADEARALKAKINEELAHKSFLVADWYRRRGKLGAARKYYGLVVKDFPGTTWADKAAGLKTDIEKKIGTLGETETPGADVIPSSPKEDGEGRSTVESSRVDEAGDTPAEDEREAQ